MNLEINVEPIDNEVKNEQYRGDMMIHAPQRKLTASDGTLANAVTRIGQIEQALINLGLLSK